MGSSLGTRPRTDSHIPNSGGHRCHLRTSSIPEKKGQPTNPVQHTNSKRPSSISRVYVKTPLPKRFLKTSRAKSHGRGGIDLFDPLGLICTRQSRPWLHYS